MLCLFSVAYDIMRSDKKLHRKERLALIESYH